MEYRTNLKQIVLFILLGVFIIIKFIAHVNRIHLGFDVFDEGFLLLMLKYPEEYNQQIFLYHKIWNYFLPKYIEVVYLRYIKLVIDFGVLLFFSFSFMLFFKRVLPRIKLPPFIFIIIIGCLAIGINSIERVYSYSSMNYSLVMVAISFFLFVPWNHTILKRFILISAIGVLLAIDFHIKLTSSVIVLLFISAYLLFEKQRLQTFVLWMIYLTSIVLIGTFFYGNYTNWWNAFLIGISNSQLEGYGSSTFYVYYLLMPFYNYAKLFFLPLLVFMILYFWARKRDSQMLFLISFVLPIITAIAILFILPKTYMANEMQIIKPFVYHVAVILPFVFLLSIFYCRSLTYAQIQAKYVLVLLLLFSAPIIVYFGSMGSLEENLIFGWLPMILLGYVFICNLNNHKRIFAQSVLILILIGTTFYFNFYYPVRSLENYQSQNIEIQIEREKLLVDTLTAQFFMEVEDAIDKHVAIKDENFLALNNLPGLVYYTGHKSPSVPLYLDFPIAEAMNRHNLEHSLKFVNGLHKRSDIKIVLMNEDVHPDLAVAVEKSLNLSNNYQKVARILNPYQGRLYNPHKDSIFSNIYIRKSK